MTTYSPKKCKRCGEIFIPTSNRQLYCNRDIEIKCPVCGKMFEAKCSHTISTTCSTECGQKYVSIRRSQNALSTTKICKWCGKEFHPRDSKTAYCYDQHYQTCAVCGKQFKIDPRKDPYVKTCSDECRYILAQRNTDTESRSEHQKESFMRKYGVTNAVHIPGSVDKIKETNRERYGSDWYTQTDEYRSRSKETCRERYGTDFALQSEKVKSKSRETWMRNYGTDNPSKSDKIKRKIKQAFNDIYGVDNFSQTRITNLDAWTEFKDDPITYIESHFDERPSVHDLTEEFGCCVASIYNILTPINGLDHVKRSKSLVENDMLAFINSIYSGDIIQSCRSKIYPYEIDIFIPDISIGFECDPTATHNSSISDPWGSDPKSPSYHKMKTDMCEEKGIFLFHIFGYEWTHKRDIIESMIKNILGKCDQKIYARKCVVKEVDSNTATKFLNANHRQGAANSSVRFGLYYQGELVSLMTFGKMRNTIGTSKNEDLSDCWELVRFCSKLNTSVVGGASKLFKYFVREYSPTRIRSFSDRAHTRGTLYQKLGFTELRRSDPGYVWVDLYTDRAYNRYNTQKQNIKKFLHDDTIDLSKSEKQIMEEHDFVQVFDCGTVTWEYHIPELYRQERSEGE